MYHCSQISSVGFRFYYMLVYLQKHNELLDVHAGMKQKLLHKSNHISF